MNAFRFPLERVMDWRRQQMELEEAKLRQQAAAIAQLDRTRAQLQAAGIAAEIDVRRWTPLAGSDLAALGGFRRHVRDQEQQLAVQRVARAQQMSGQQQVLLEARRRYRLLERLRERRLAEWQEAVDRELETLAAESHSARLSREARRVGR